VKDFREIPESSWSAKIVLGSGIFGELPRLPEDLFDGDVYNSQNFHSKCHPEEKPGKKVNRKKRKKK